MVEFKNAKIYNIPEKERSRFHLRCTFISVQCPGPVFFLAHIYLMDGGH